VSAVQSDRPRQTYRSTDHLDIGKTRTGLEAPRREHACRRDPLGETGTPGDRMRCARVSPRMWRA
jgi:hypothetical protein